MYRSRRVFRFHFRDSRLPQRLNQYAPTLFACGFLMIILAMFMLLPAIVALVDGSAGAREFGISSLISGGIGSMLYHGFKGRFVQLVAREMFILTCIVWLVVCCVAAIPLSLVSHISAADAFFETMSGVTTTGSTILSGLDDIAPAILLWRSLLQWLGGIGFVVMGVAILPFLQVGGMRLFQTESSDWSEKAFPRARQVAAAIASVYLLLTLSCTLLYWMFGMGPFEAINYALTTVSTGGYATSDASFGHFSGYALHVIAIVFMLLGSVPFMLYVRYTRGEFLALFRDQQVRGLLALILFATTVLSLWLMQHQQISLGQATLMAGFNVVSVVTTTGFASSDYGHWGQFSMMVFFYLTFIGGCSGSTTGGMKIFRFQLAWGLLRKQLLQLAFPHRMLSNTYNGRAVTDDIMRSIVAFSFAFFASIGALALFLSMLQVDFLTALTAAATAVSNVGPGLGEMIGPDSTFASLPDAAKWALCGGMLMGRLEVMTVLILFSSEFWKG